MEFSRLKRWSRAQRNLLLIFRIDVFLDARRRCSPRSAVSALSLFHGSDAVAEFVHLSKLQQQGCGNSSKLVGSQVTMGKERCLAIGEVPLDALETHI
jgi:hypothetical protein